MTVISPPRQFRACPLLLNDGEIKQYEHLSSYVSVILGRTVNQSINEFIYIAQVDKYLECLRSKLMRYIGASSC